ncbi:MAG: outer membrane protein assembly factor [Planctomycetota bacterium]|nr:outer membrane protein assembly factor [Planctomycetota bacterium]
MPPLCRFALLCTLLALLVTADAVVAQEKGTVSTVKFEGNRRIPDSLLLSKIRTRPGEVFSEKVLDEDVKRLTRLGKFLPISAEWGADPTNPNWVVVTFRVRDRDEVRWVRFPGRKGIKRTDLEDLLQTKKGTLLSDYFIRLDQESIEGKYLQEGYLFASVNPIVKPLSLGVGVNFEIEEGPRVKVEEIEFEGNDHLEASDLRDQMQIKERGWLGILDPGIYRDEILLEDLDALRRFCRDRGFLDALVFLESIDFAEDKEWVKVKIRIIEGQKYVVSEIRFTESHRDAAGREIVTGGVREGPYSEAYLRGRLFLKPGGPMLGSLLRRDVLTVQRLYQRKSRIRTIVRHRVEPEEKGPSVKVIFNISRAEATRVGRILIRGNSRTKSKVIRRELAFYPGEPFDIATLEQSFRRLRRTRFFKPQTMDIRLDRSDTEVGVENVIVEVEEAPTGNLIIGGGIASTVGFFGNFQLRQTNFDITKVPTSWEDLARGNNFEGGGQTLQLIAQPGRKATVYQIQFIEPYLLDLPLRLRLDAAWRIRDRFDYSERRAGATVSLGHQLTHNSIVSLRYRRENVLIRDLDRDAASDVLKVEGTNRLAVVGVVYRLNTSLQDNQLVYFGGSRLTASYDWMTRALGSEFNLNRFETTFDQWFHLFEIPNWGKVVVRAWVGGGWIEGYSDTSEVPIFERFFIGGPTRMRGFEYREVGPSESNRPIGGTVMTVEGVELEFPILQEVFRGVFFLDTGNIAENFGSFSLNEHRVSVGVGLRIKVPIFPVPIELDFGVPLRMQPEDERRTFSFFIGFPF